jgi:hypothetical protein
MMLRKTYIFIFAFLLLFSSFVSAQWIESENFIEVSSAQVGSHSQGCFVASMTGMIASINHPKIGSDPAPIIKSMDKKLCKTGAGWPYPSADVLSAVVQFLVGAI